MSESNSGVLLFDLGGVLIENRMFSELKRLMESQLSEAELIDMWLTNSVARQFELGRCSADEFAHSIIAQFDLPLDPAEFLNAFRYWPKGFYAGVESLLADLRTRFRVCCLSNSNEVHWTDAVTGHFDIAFSSHLMGYIKPDASAFDYALRVIDVTPEEVHYFDDAQRNVEAARACGMMAYHTVGYDQLKSTLATLGLLAANIPGERQ